MRVASGRAWALALALLPSLAACEDTAVLRLESVREYAGWKADLPSKRHAYPAIFADWVQDKEERLADAPLVHPSLDPYGCQRLPNCQGCALLVLQGNCSFAHKARRAAKASAVLLIVATAEDGPAVRMSASGGWTIFGPSRPKLPAISVSKRSGDKILWAHDHGHPLIASCWKREPNLVADISSEVLVAALAIGLVALGAWHSVEDLRRPESKARLTEEVFAVEESSGFQFVIFGSLMLTVLFFFMKYLIYVLLLMFASGAVSTTAALLEPAFAAYCPPLRANKAFQLPKWLAGFTGLEEDHSCADALAEFVGLVLAGSFLVYRNDETYGWLLQDTIGILLLLTIQRTLRLPNLKVGTLLLVCTFFFDIFWVFLSPMIFKKSVMIEVATGGGTGQSVPMVLKIPALIGDLPGQFKILGLGDVAIPGLLISLLLRHDLVRHSPRFGGYFTAGVIGYAAGLAATFISLYLMQHGQPALLFLVPGTLLPTFFIACRKGELGLLWSASYGPDKPPEGYESLPNDDNKTA